MYQGDTAGKPSRVSGAHRASHDNNAYQSTHSGTQIRNVNSTAQAISNGTIICVHRLSVPGADVIVDTARPPKDRLTLFNLYVVLSRSSGRDTIRLLRDFDDEVLLVPHAAEMQQEDDRLEKLKENTIMW